jgi:hypothetical protein
MPCIRISDDLRWAAVRLVSLGHDVSYVAMVTGMRERTVESIYSQFQATGTVGSTNNAAPRLRRPRILGNHEVAVSVVVLECCVGARLRFLHCIVPD